MPNSISANSADLLNWHMVLKVLHTHPLLPTAAAGASERMEQVFALMGYLQPLSTYSWQLLDTGHQAN